MAYCGTIGVVLLCFGLIQARMVNKRDPADALDWSFYAQLGSTFLGNFGGGSIINQNYVLTSGHNVVSYPPWLEVFPAYFQSIGMGSGPSVPISSVLIDPFRTYTSNDVALVKMGSAYTGPTVTLNTDAACPAAGDQCTAVINLQDGGVYRKIPVEVLDQASCTQLGYGSDFMCVRVSNPPGGMCALQSGSPLMCTCGGQQVQVAVASGALASGSRGCDSNNIYTYTRVTAVKQFIDQNSQ